MSDPSTTGTKIVELNGKRCCLLELPCCPPPPTGISREKALASLIRQAVDIASNGSTMLTPHEAETSARALLEHFDLVPAGLGKAITQAYSTWLRTEVK